MATLTDLDKLKAEHGLEFRAAAPKRRRKGLLCWRFRCRSIKFVHLPAGLGLEDGWCQNKRCPRRALEDYLSFLGRTRAWRRQPDGSFWRHMAEVMRRKVKEALRG